jgi:hypothetical protein
MAADINFGHTQMMQRELQAQQDFSVAEIFGAPPPRALPRRARALLSRGPAHATWIRVITAAASLSTGSCPTHRPSTPTHSLGHLTLRLGPPPARLCAAG